MRNKLFTFLVAFGLMIAGTASASLYNYFNGDLPSIQERTPLAEQCGIYDYAGTYEQNIALEDCLSGEGSDQMLGVTIPDVVALFEDNLGATLTKTATSSMTLVSGEDKEGNALSGTFGFIIDEGTTREEFIIATCAGTACTDLERGISVEDGKTTVVALQFKHRLGASIKMTNYPILGRMASVLKGTDSTGKGIFIIGDDTNSIKFDTTTTSIKYMYAWDSSSNPFLRYNGSNWQFSDDGVSSVNMVTGGGGLSASSTQGIQINSSEIGVIVSSTQGMYGGADGQGVYQKSKTDGGILKSSDGDYITTSSLVSAGVATSTPTADKIPIADGSGKIDDDWISDNLKSQIKFTTTADETISANDLVTLLSAPTTKTGLVGQASGEGTSATNTNGDRRSTVFTIPENVSEINQYSVTVRETSGGIMGINCNVSLQKIDTGTGYPDGSKIHNFNTSFENDASDDGLTSAGSLGLAVTVGDDYAIVVEKTGDDGSWQLRGNSVQSDPLVKTAVKFTAGGTGWETESIYGASSLSNVTYGAIGLFVQSDNETLLESEVIGVATASSTDGNSLELVTSGVMSGFTGLVKGTSYYVSANGAVADSGTKLVGRAISTTELYINIDN